MKSEKRNHKRFNLKNTLVQFPEEKGKWGRIVDISKSGLKVLCNMKFKDGETTIVAIRIKKISNMLSSNDYMRLKMKIVWKQPNAEGQGSKICYGALFVDVGDAERKQLNFFVDKVKMKEKMSDKDIENVLSDVGAYLQFLRKQK